MALPELLKNLFTLRSIMLYNIPLPINQYNGSITKNVIAKTINRFGISHGYFIRFWLFHQIL